MYISFSKEICVDLLSKVRMLNYKPIDTSIVHNHKLRKYPNQVPTNKEGYQKLVGKLIYWSHTHPDIAYVISMVNQFMHSPSEDHLDAIVWILHYLKSAPRKGLLFPKNNHLNIDGYTDVDWPGSVSNRKSTLSYFTFVGGNLATWRSKK